MSDELFLRIVTDPGVYANPPWKDRLTLRGLARLPVALS